MSTVIVLVLRCPKVIVHIGVSKSEFWACSNVNECTHVSHKVGFVIDTTAIWVASVIWREHGWCAIYWHPHYNSCRCIPNLGEFLNEVFCCSWWEGFCSDPILEIKHTSVHRGDFLIWIGLSELQKYKLAGIYLLYRLYPKCFCTGDIQMSYKNIHLCFFIQRVFIYYLQ